MMVLSTVDKRIKYLSYCYHGSTHDFTLLKEELPPDKGEWFKKNEVHVDLGYQGIAKQYQCAKLFIPTKKPKGEELTKKQKKQNKKKSPKKDCCRKCNWWNEAISISFGQSQVPFYQAL